MKLRLDTSRTRFTCTREPVEKLDQKGRPRFDRETSEPLFTLQVMALDENGGDIANVTVKGMRPKVSVGQEVTFIDLEALPYSIGDRSGVAFRAGDVKPVTAPKAA